MNIIDALNQAKADGFTKAICVPYTYHPRTIDSHIVEIKKFMQDPDYPISLSCVADWKYDPAERRIDSFTNGIEQHESYLLMYPRK